MNAEADLAELFGAGLITPIKLHYVRNHGSVPALDWDTHQLEVYSTPSHLLSKPRSFTMDELAAMEWIDIPVVLACDGNRRQEVNMIKKSGGFGWGSSGVSCVRWKGVPVSKVLRACGLEGNGNAKSGARLWLNYEGADEPSEGKYSTCIPLAHAMDETNDVILA